MRFGVLGPVSAVDRAGAAIPLNAAKQRALLAILLCWHDTAVPVDRLLHLLWPGSPPPSARANVQVYVHRLRRKLGDATITHSSGGYQLITDPGHIDAVRFEHDAADGRACLDEGDLDKARDLLGAALDLWRGAAYAGLEEIEPLRVEASRLEELRLVTLENRIEADLQLGRHAALTAELTRLIADHPLRERLRRHLMLALYRSGRAADALEAYRSTRQFTIEEFGLEPGPDLRALEQAILTDDPSISATAPALELQARQTYKIPAELPWPDRSFTGRDSELAQITAQLSAPPRTRLPQITAISGPAGVGKSAIAQRVAQAVSAHYPDGQLYINLHGATPGAEPMPAREALGRLLRSLGVADADVPGEVDEAAATFRSIVADRHLLIVLDNAADAGQVRPLLPGCGSQSAVIVTSRPVPAALDGADHIRLGNLSDAESVTLLSRLVGGARVTAEPEVAREITRMCDHLPLALRIAGARLVSRPDWTLRALRERLRDETVRLDELTHADLAVRASCAMSLHGLAAADARAFAVLGVLDLPDFTTPTIAAAIDHPISATRPVLDGLVDAQLLAGSPDDRYVMHDLVRLYAKELAGETIDPEDGLAARRRVIHFHLATLRAVARILAPGREHRMRAGVLDDHLVVDPLDLGSGDDAAAWVRAESANLVATARLAAAMGAESGALTLALSAALPQVLTSQGLWAEQEAISMLALETVRGSGRLDWLALAHHDRGVIAAIYGSRPLAVGHFDEALRMFTSLDDDDGRALTLESLGNCHTIGGGSDHGSRYHLDAIAIVVGLGDVWREARVRNNLAWSYQQQSQWEAALAEYGRSLRLREQVGDRPGAAVTLLNLGGCRLAMDDAAGAIADYDRAGTVFGEIGDSRRHAMALWKSGTALHSLGRREEARASWRRGLDLVRIIGLITDDEAEQIMADPVPDQPLTLREV